ncbi:leucyl aminopeptidase family protein [Parasulfitobacter algicola]|uniref:Leucyl aminopeptidase family protein n=1 Tax=Parasulfitobacter algicola TaxID=2614809 RepID=A0ABX2IWV5_9RHOB|nr:leucyl aminopeptidase family protein [Sulfitobacter algicola]NSX55645.1 leucyl aminopeptidase family protein [Sulfitobacter algicola]
MPLAFAAPDTQSVPIHIVDQDGLSDWITKQDEVTQSWVNAHAFQAKLGKFLAVPSANGHVNCIIIGNGTAASRKRSRFALADVSNSLPAGVYHLQTELADDDATEFALGWLLAQYRFSRYATQADAGAVLKAPGNVDANRIQIIAQGECLTRDLINTPASDMGPDALETAFLNLAQKHNATPYIISGNDLIAQNLPLIHTVGRASVQEPRLLDMRWGKTGPQLTLIGKGVCFDTGGLNIKPAASMGLMKKDMGGAATVMGLAHMIMALDLPLRLRVLIPAVENAIDGSAFRPQDILTSRKGLTVEVNNTDAEGRLVLADALALADEEPTDCIISMATLTGAARVAVGPDLAPFYTDNTTSADAIRKGAVTARDPVWEMPFWDPYEKMIEPGIADLDNAPAGGFAGSITAALFLRRFVTEAENYVHFDIYSWQPSAAPARPKGGVGQGARALLEALPNMVNL